MGFRAAQYVFGLTGLTTAQQCILQRIGWSCMDESAFLPRSKEWLANSCAISLRSLERHLPSLAKLNLAIWNGSGFRLPEFYRQFGGQNVGQIGGAYKEGFQRIPVEGKPPVVPLCEGDTKETENQKPEPGTGDRDRQGKPKRLTRDERKRLAMKFERPKPEVHPDSHVCTRCDVPHEWACNDPACTVYGREYACLAAVSVRAP